MVIILKGFFVLYVSVEVIMRAEAVEMAQPGDKVDFIGTFIVVPDVSQLAIPGKFFVCLFVIN